MSRVRRVECDADSRATYTRRGTQNDVKYGVSRPALGWIVAVWRRSRASSTGCSASISWRALGLSASAVRNRAPSGRLHRIHHAVYSLVPPSCSRATGATMAAVLACGPGAVLSHRSAAALHELRAHRALEHRRHDPGSLAPQARRHRRPPLDHAHARGHHADRQHPLHDGRPDDPRPRPGRQPARLERALDQAEILELLDLDAIDDQLDRNRPAPPPSACERSSTSTTSARPRPGASSRKRSCGSAASRASRSPRSTLWIVPGDGEPTAIRADFVWREQRVDRRDRRPQDAPHPPGVRARPPPRSAADRRRVDGDPHDLAAADTSAPTRWPPGSPGYCGASTPRAGLEPGQAHQPLPPPSACGHLPRRAPAEALHLPGQRARSP